MLLRKDAEKEVFDLLRQWCDALTALQVRMPSRPDLDGGILCPACHMIHGRCIDAVYPLLFMADKTGDARYLRAAKRLFRWGETMLCPDGSMRNDAKSDWRGVTVFHAIALHDALTRHGHLLTKSERAAWEARLLRMGDWLCAHLTAGAKAYINYYAANACAMALIGKTYDKPDALSLARSLADYCLRHVSENGLLYGESAPHDARSAKGCLAIDMGGYNAEESLPCLTRYALTVGDEAALDACRSLWHAHLPWMLPDGAWDDSIGIRAFKWTYWGSRTADGCQDALFALGKDSPVFAEAAWRNFTLYRACTHKGLLNGGPDYHRHGERACVHHTFCHAKALAGTLDAGLYDMPRVTLPSDDPPALRHYPEVDACRLACGDWRADMTAYDMPNRRANHASGGAVSLLWHRRYGAVIACGAPDFTLAEPFNQQLPLRENDHRSPCPRIEAVIDGVPAAQHYDFGASLTFPASENGIAVRADAWLCDAENRRVGDDGRCTLIYTLTEDGLHIAGEVSPAVAACACYRLPILSPDARVTVTRGTTPDDPVPMFCICPGFSGREFTIHPDADGRFGVQIR